MKPAIDQLHCLSITHKTAPLAIRERLSRRVSARWVQVEELFEKNGLAAIDPFQGMALLTTCGRIEIILTLPADQSLFYIENLIEEWTDQSMLDLGDMIRWRTGWSAVHYLAEVAAGLDSKVLGEPQILGQFSRTAAGQLPPERDRTFLGRVLHAILRTGKRVRRETGLSRRSTSMSSIAVSMVTRAVPDRLHGRILVVGAGEMSGLAAKALAAYGYRRVIIANRTLAAAKQLAGRWGFEAVSLEKLPRLVGEVDAIICAAAAPQPLITPTMIRAIKDEGRSLPKLIIDLALHPNVAPGAAAGTSIQLVDVDHLRTDLDQSLTSRQAEIPAAQAIIAEIRPAVEDALRELALRPIIAGFRQQIEEVRQQELARTRRQLGEIDPAVAEQLDLFSQALINKLFHEPTSRLRELPVETSAEYSAALQALFGPDHPRGGAR